MHLLRRKKLAGFVEQAVCVFQQTSAKQIKLLEETAQRLYKEWFVDLRFPGYETTPVLDGVPEGWRRYYRKLFINLCQ